MSICREIINIIKLNLNHILSLRNDLELKSDNSYVSKGDILVQNLILEYLYKISAIHNIISEELPVNLNGESDNNQSYIVIDPIDGTENFVSGLKEWGVSISIYEDGVHKESCIYLPELDDCHITGMPTVSYNSRIYGLSSSLMKEDLLSLPIGNYEYRIIGCAVYNILMAARGSFKIFENFKGANTWDILAGINIALEHGKNVYVNEIEYKGEFLYPNIKYKFMIR